MELLDRSPKALKNVRIISKLGNGKISQRQGSFVRVLGNLDPQGRMARVLVKVNDPLNRGNFSAGKQLLLGSYVEVEIVGRKIHNVIKIPRSSLREGNEIWISDENSTLKKLPVEIAFQHTENIYVRGEIPIGSQVITSTLQTPLEGMSLKNLAEKIKAVKKKVSSKSL